MERIIIASIDLTGLRLPTIDIGRGNAHTPFLLGVSQLGAGVLGVE